MTIWSFYLCGGLPYRVSPAAFYPHVRIFKRKTRKQVILLSNTAPELRRRLRFHRDAL